MSSQQVINGISVKLDGLSRLLDLHPYDDSGRHLKQLKAVSTKEIEPALVICPTSMECQTVSCNRRHILLDTRDRDVPRVTLIKGIKIHDEVHVLRGKCDSCDTIYYADHESSFQESIPGQRLRFYLNGAKYLKVGQKLWVDRSFSGAVIGGTYSFHASSAAFAEFWNDSFWSTQETTSRKLSRWQIWHAFVQESVQKVAQSSKQTLEIQDGLPIDEVTKHAFVQLGEQGIIRSAGNHSCSECTHTYKRVADRITGDDPAALVGIDENRHVPALAGEGADLAVQDAAQARLNAQNAMDVVEEPSSVDGPPVNLVVMDGIVMGPAHCALEGCTEDLAKVRGGVFCVQHELEHGHLCHMHNCSSPKVPLTHTCTQHQNHWYHHVVRYGRQSLLGIRRLVRHTEEERLAWLSAINQQVQQHDARPNEAN